MEWCDVNGLESHPFERMGPIEAVNDYYNTRKQMKSHPFERMGPIEAIRA